jgi:hypothetical protein
MANDVSVLLDLAKKSPVNVWPATFVGLDDDGWVLCDIKNGDASGRVPAQVWTPYRPEVGERVFVVSVNGAFFLVGPAMPKPAQGTVKSVGSSVVTLDTDMGSVQATYDAGTTLSVSQEVKLLWSGGAHVVGILTAPAPPPPPPAPPEPVKRRHVDVFQPVDAGSFSGGRWWQPQPWASDSTLGAWFYGSKIRDTLQGAPVSKVEIWSTLASRMGSLPNFGIHPHASKLAGGPAITSATPIAPPNGGWLTLPTGFGQQLANAVGGIGLAHGGFNKFRSLSDDPQSGALRITSTY